MRLPFFPIGFVVAGVILTAASARAAAKATSDIATPQKRQAVVEIAERLANRGAVKPLPADLSSPFNPKNFDKSDPVESRAVVQQNAAGPSPAGEVPAGGTVPSSPVKPAAPSTDRETLETLAAQITPSGVIMLRGTPRLIFANRPFEVGTRFTAAYNNQDYELELVSIDRTTFTLRYRGEEITRPIKPVR